MHSNNSNNSNDLKNNNSNNNTNHLINPHNSEVLNNSNNLNNSTSTDSQANEKLVSLIASSIEAAGGWLSFAEFMHMALYTPELGYYSADRPIFGAAGDFVTAPELTPLFGATLARQVLQITAQSQEVILECGAGSGKLAADILQALHANHALPKCYYILEVSAYLRQRQQQTIAEKIPQALPLVRWIDRLPSTFSGCVIANEVIDAMPVHLLLWRDGVCYERGVSLQPRAEGTPSGDCGFCWAEKPADGALLAAANELDFVPPADSDYCTEINLAARAFIAEWGRILQQGALIIIDYGFPQAELYHPDRSEGSLMCHFRQQSHPDPFFRVGECDITAHVDFTSLIASGHQQGLSLLGYTTQAHFLINLGLFEQLQALAADQRAYAQACSAVHQLTSPAEMGELFKVMALGKGLTQPLIGFASGDRRMRL